MGTITSFSDAPAFAKLCQLPVEKLAQHVLIQRDIIRALQASAKEPEDVTCFTSRIAELEELLAETKDILKRIIEGNPVEWDV